MLTRNKMQHLVSVISKTEFQNKFQISKTEFQNKFQKDILFVRGSFIVLRFLLQTSKHKMLSLVSFSQSSG